MVIVSEAEPAVLLVGGAVVRVAAEAAAGGGARQRCGMPLGLVSFVK